ncbi:MAG: porin [Candidatus Dadabacteria bacterium]|nr:MAG: porin [Candidatus Dadabacteria bacterium]
MKTKTFSILSLLALLWFGGVGVVFAQSRGLDLDIHGFSHIQYDVVRTDPTGGDSETTNGFTTGGIDFFVTSELSDSFHFLNETVLEFEEGGGTSVDVERVLLKYTYNEALSISAGRGHTALGYWNQRFHHGTWLQTTTDRPIIYLFEDDGGILPVHFVGLEFSGSIFDDQISYTANVANGRGSITDEVQQVGDKNDSKMVSLMVEYEPEALEGFGVGANILFDRIPSDAAAGRPDQFDELIYGAHLYYTEDPVEFLAEIQFIDHSNSSDFSHWGAYIQAAYSFDNIKPYYRFDILDIESGDPFFTGLEGVEDQTQHTVGIRWDMTTYVAAKLEYRHLDADSEDSDAGTLQVSFAF